MAKIVFGMAVPHSGMLGQAPEDWLKNGERDRSNPELWYRNRTWTYAELEAHREAAFEKFTFANPVDFYTGTNPSYFKGTVVEAAVDAYLAER